MIRFSIFIMFIILFPFMLAECEMAKAADFILTWNAPTTNVDGTPLTDLAGYKVYYGTTSKIYGTPVDVKNALTYTVIGLQSDTTYYFAVTAYDKSIPSNESKYSNEVSKMKSSLKSILYTSLNNYSDVIVGKEIYKYMEIRNDSDKTIIISNITVEGDDYRVVATFPKTINPGDSISCKIYFKPIKKGLRLGKISIIADTDIVEKGLSGNGM